MCAFDLKDGALRDQVIAKTYEEGVIVIGSGPNSIRFRPPLVITKAALAEGLEKLRGSIRKSIGR
jgi:L-lysine 6-transaminase